MSRREGVLSGGEWKGPNARTPADRAALLFGVLGLPERVLRRGHVLFSAIVVLLEVLGNVGHVSAASVTILFGCAVWHVRPNDPCACSGGRVNGNQIVGVWKGTMQVKVTLYGVAVAGEGYDDLCL